MSLSILDSKKRGNSYVVCVKKSKVSGIGNTKKDKGASKKLCRETTWGLGKCRDVFV